MQGDQYPAALKVKRFGSGFFIQKNVLTIEGVEASLREALANPSYRSRAQKLAAMLRHEDDAGIAVSTNFWLDYAMRHHGQVLERLVPNNRHLNFFALYSLDIGIAILAVSVVCFLTFIL